MPTTSSTLARHATRRTVFLLAAVMATSWLAGCERAKTRLDREVDRLCAIDGGVKVFETVEVPPEYLPDDRAPFPQYAGRPGEERYGPEYEVRELDTYIVEGDPYLVRHEWRIVRRKDQKIMGSSVRYWRTGGDLPGPWARSSHRCPSHESNDLVRSVFVKQGAQK